ncbi:MAG: LysR family transcriptional regulator [Alphaproteobacteria bacterium]|nr:LysR family transcriptional regulator [Alphaproteobacteria bacterium]
MHKINWQDLQYILIVARQGSVSAAARTLGVNHSTVLRRINALEERQGLRLFDRLRTGYVLSQEGQQLLQAAQSIEDTVTGLERRIAGAEVQLEGTIRVTTTDSVLLSICGNHIAKFQKTYPNITIELTVTSSILSLSRRDADVAIRPSRFEPERLTGERISDFYFALYAGADFWAANSETPLAEQPWLAPDESMAGSPAGRWLRAEVPEAKIVMAADSFLALGDAARRNLGVAILPCAQGDVMPDLVRIGEPLKDYKTGLWVLTHRDLLGAVRISTFYGFMIDALKAEERSMKGER